MQIDGCNFGKVMGPIQWSRKLVQHYLSQYIQYDKIEQEVHLRKEDLMQEPSLRFCRIRSTEQRTFLPKVDSGKLTTEL